jgi:hypothetical protein
MGTLVNGLCQDCPAGKTTCGLASASCVTCSPCEAGKFSATGTACGPCSPSIADGAKPGETFCSDCAAGKYSSAGQTTCLSCAAGKVACATGMSACNNGCNVAGFTGPDVSCTCTACAPGTYKLTAGTMACTNCPANTFHRPDPLGSFLVTNPAHLATSAEAWDDKNMRFTDLSGNGRHGVTTSRYEGWDTAIDGPFILTENVNGNGAGRPITAVTSDGIVDWGAASVPTTFTICSVTRLPNAGSGYNTLMCTDKRWLHAHYEGAAGCWAYNNLVVTEWRPDGANGLYPITEPACLKVPKNDWVVACGKNNLTASAKSIKNGIGWSQWAVGAGQTSAIINGVVGATTGGGEGGCRLGLNGINTWSMNPQDSWQLSRLYVWNKHLSDADFVEASTRLNAFVKNTVYAETTSVNCVSCPASAPISPAGSSSVAACQRLCPPGSTGPVDPAMPCTSCPAGTYKTTSGSAACTLCPVAKYSATVGASSAGACKMCDPVGIMTTFILPGDGSWNTAWTPLPDSAIKFEGATRSTDCVCDGGYYKVDGQFGGPCTACPVGKYKQKFVMDWTGLRDKCLDCPLGSFSEEVATYECRRCNEWYAGWSNCLVGSASFSDCVPWKTCAAGQTGPDGHCGRCDACAAGSYKAVTGSSPCVQCFAGASSPAGSTAESACVCGPGLYKF